MKKPLFNDPFARGIAVLGAVLALAAVGLTFWLSSTYSSESGAARSVSDPRAPWLESYVVETIDNREVVCVYADVYKQGGLSCDWANAVPVSK